MGEMADQLTEDMLDAKALHDAGECNDWGCEWCRAEEEEEARAALGAEGPLGGAPNGGEND